MMLPFNEETLISHPRIGCRSSATWWYLSAEFIFGLTISGLLTILATIKALLPKPPKDLTGDVVLVTGVSSSLGRNLAKEFAKNGCQVVCIDQDLKTAKEIASDLRLEYPTVLKVGSENHKEEYHEGKQKATNFAYECNFEDKNDIRNVAKKIKNEVGWINVLVTCTGDPSQDIFDTISRTLMSHYWTVMAFLPWMLHRGRAHVIGVMPTLSTEDAYMGSKAAIAGLMESLGQFCQGQNELTFITVAPKSQPRFLKQNDQQIAADVVRAVKRNQSSLCGNWCFDALYSISCSIYWGITCFTQWLDT